MKKQGEIWEFHNTTRETVTEYEVMNYAEHPTATENEREEAAAGNLVFLRNPLTDGIAEVSRRWLAEGEARTPHSHWRLKA